MSLSLAIQPNNWSPGAWSSLVQKRKEWAEVSHARTVHGRLESNIAVLLISQEPAQQLPDSGGTADLWGEALYIASGFPWRIQMSSSEGHFS